MNLILCGLSRCGKSTIGKKLAENLSWAFIDIDDLTGQRELFFEKGESYFRNQEKEAVASIKDVSHTVIATGGGTLLDADNRKILKSLGLCIYLKIEPWLALKRGLSPHLALQEEINKRIPLYEAIADITIEATHLTEEEVLWQATALEIFSK